MANDLKILITGALDPKTTAGQINKDLSKLQDKIDKLNLSIKVDQSILKTLNDFATQMNKLADIAKNTGKVIQESINPDGSRTKITSYNGIINEIQELGTKAKQAGDAVKSSSEQQVKYLNQVKGAFNDVTKVVEKYNAEQEKLNTKVTLANGNNTRTVNLNSQNQVTGITDTTNRAKDLQDTQKLIDAKKQLRQELIKLGDTGNVTAKQLAQVRTALNNASDINGLQQAKQEYSQLSENAKIAEQMAQGRERAALSTQQAEQKAIQAQQNAINRNNELTRQEIEQQKQLEAEITRRLQLYQREAQITASNISSKYGSHVDQSALNNQLSSVMNANSGQFQNLQQLRNFISEFNTGFRELTAGIDNASHHAMSFMEQLKMGVSMFSVWMLSATAVMQVWQSIRDGITYVNQLNDALTQISIVTGQNQSQVDSLGQSYNKLAQSMSVSTTEITNEATELYRQGLNQDQVESRMRTITEYAKISSLDTKTATEIMTAAINSMGVSAKRAADVWSYLGDATATGADEIGRAMQKVGGTAGSLKIPFEQVSSWISVISSRTRESAETVGQGVKSILARVQSLKEYGFDSTDNTSVNQVSKALSSIGVNLMDSQGQFRNFGKVMDDIGKKWNNLDSRQKAYIATTVKFLPPNIVIY
jgi:TP901 family phage tail tape measure protein